MAATKEIAFGENLAKEEETTTGSVGAATTGARTTTGAKDLRTSRTTTNIRSNWRRRPKAETGRRELGDLRPHAIEMGRTS